MNCADALEHITEYIEGALPAPARMRMEEHLRSCSACAKAARDIAELAQSLRSLAPAEVPPGFQRRLNARLDMLTASPFRRYLIPAAVGAGLIAISFGVMHVTQPASRTAKRVMPVPAVPSQHAFRARLPQAAESREKVLRGLGRGAREVSKVAPAAGQAEQPQVAEPTPGADRDVERRKTDSYGGAAWQVERVPQARRAIPLPPITSGQNAPRPAGQAAAGTTPPAAGDEHPVIERSLTYGGQTAGPAAKRRQGVVQEELESRGASTGKLAPSPAAASPTSPRESKPVLKVLTLPGSVMPGPGGPTGAPAIAARGWLASARVRLARAETPYAARGLAPVALDIEPLPAAPQPERGAVQHDEVAAPRLRNVEVTAVSLSAGGPRLAQPGGPSAPAPTVRAALREGASNTVPLANVQAWPYPYARPSDVYRVALVSDDGERRSFLLFVPPSGPAPAVPAPRQALPVESLALLTAQAGVTLLTPADLPTAYSIGVMRALPEDALLTALKAIGLKVERDGRTWTAERR